MNIRSFAALTITAALISACGGGDETPTVSADRLQAAFTSLPVETGTSPGYYVDADNGVDQLPGGTYASPWKTLAYAQARLSSTGTPLASGEGLFLRCGSTWRESLVLTTHLGPAPKFIAGYGSNCNTSKATISGADDLKGGWTQDGTSNVWSKTLAGPEVKRLFVGTTTFRAAQWPNFVQIGQEFAKVKAGAALSKTKIAVATADQSILSSSSNPVAGARVVIRVQPYTVEQYTVSSYSEVASQGYLDFSPSTVHNIEPGAGYILQGKRWMLDAPGEFFHDVNNSRLYVQLTPAQSSADILNTGSVEGSIRAVGMSINKNSPGPTIQDIAFVRTTGDGLSIVMPEVKVDRIEASENYISGLRAAVYTEWVGTGKRSVTVQNSLFRHNWLYGINSGYNKFADILNNVVEDTGNVGFAGGVNIPGANDTTAAISVGGQSLVQGNIIHRTAKSGILYLPKEDDHVEIKDNDIVDFCLRLSDCGGIYTWNGQYYVPFSGSVSGNRLWNAKANLEGATGSAALIVAGIYYDDKSMYMNTNGNLIANTPVGVYVHNGANHTITDNKIWLTKIAGLWANMDEENQSYDYNEFTVFQNNEIIPAATTLGAYPALPEFPTSYAIRNDNVIRTGPPSGSVMYSGNKIIQINGQSVPTVYASWGHGSGYTYESFTAKGWKVLNTAEVTPTIPATFGLYSVTTNQTLVNAAFSSDLESWGSSVSGTGSVGWVTSASGCTGGCVSLTAGASYSDGISSPTIQVDGGTMYIASLKSGFSGGKSRIKPWIKEQASPYTNLSPTLNSPFELQGNTGDTMSYEGFFKTGAISSPTASSFLVQLVGTDVPVNLDSISLKRVTGYTRSAVHEYAAFAIANRGNSKLVDCASFTWGSGCSAVDSTGASASLSSGVTLGAGTSRLFLKTNSPWFQ